VCVDTLLRSNGRERKVKRGLTGGLHIQFLRGLQPQSAMGWHHKNGKMGIHCSRV
jgi:hypothetical protein